MAGGSNFVVRGGADFTPIEKAMQSMQKQFATFQKDISKSINTNMSKSFKGMQKDFQNSKKEFTSMQSGFSNGIKLFNAALAGLAIGNFVKDSVSQAMSVESSVFQISRILGKNAIEFGDWAETQAKAFGIARAEAYKYGAVYGNLISGFSKNIQETAKYTKELIKASAITASATGRTMEDTMERIRSGLLGNTEAIEDLGIYAQVAMLKSTKAFKEFSNGKTWDQLDFQTQQQIRLMSILEQVNTKYGDSLAGTTATKQMMFVATLKNIQLNLGQAFLPIYNIVLPALTALANQIENITAKIAAFSQALFGMNDAQAKTSAVSENAKTNIADMGKEVQKAGKKAKGSLAGFDQLNTLSKETSDNMENMANASGMSIGNQQNNQSPKTFEAIEQAKKVMSGLSSILKQNFGSNVSQAFDNISNSIKTLSSVAGGFLGTIWNLFKSSFLDILASKNWSETIDNIKWAIDSMGGAISNAISVISEFLKIIDNTSKNAFPSLQDGLASLGGGFLNFKTDAFALGIAIVNDSLDLLKKALRDNSDSFTNILTPAAKIAGDMMNIVGQIFSGTADLIKRTYTNNIEPLKNLILDVFGTFMSLINDLANKWIYPLLLPAIEETKKIIGPAFAEISKSVSSSIGSIIEILKLYWEKNLKPLVKWIQDNIVPVLGPVFTAIGKTIGDVFSSAISLVKNLFGALDGILQFISGTMSADWEKAWNGMAKVFENVWKGLVNVARIPLNSIIRMINSMFDKLNAIKIDIPAVDIPGIGKMGGSKIGFPSIPKINEIPALANGGITDVNNPFLSIIGDNKRQREVVAPLDELTKIMLTAINQSQQTKQSNTKQDFVFQINGREFARIASDEINNLSRSLGVSVIAT
jgi:phage-related protein